VSKQLQLVVTASINCATATSVITLTIHFLFRAKKVRIAESGSSQDRLSLQQFVYEDGYIACSGNRELVLSVQEQDGGNTPAVCLAKRRVEDICQRWIVTDYG